MGNLIKVSSAVADCAQTLSASARCGRSVRTTRKVPAAVLVVMLLAPLCSSAADAEALQRPFSFGIVPQQSATMLARLWGPVLQYLGEIAGCELRFRTAPDIPAFEMRVRAGEYDLAYMNPYHFTVFHEDPGYHAVAKAKGRVIRGLVVVQRDSTISHLEDLEGAAIAFPAPAAFAATILPQSALRQRGIGFLPTYVSSHDSVYRAVARGLYPAGGGIIRTLTNVEPAVRDQLRVLWRTPGYTPHAFAAHPSLDAGVTQRIADAMYQMAQDPRGRELLATLKLDGLVPAQSEDWDDVRSLNIRILD